MTYTELKAAISDWLHRADLSTPATTFVVLAEERLQDLKLNRFTTSATLTVTAGQTAVALPANYLEGRGLAGGSWDWTLCTPEQLIRTAEGSGEVHSYAIYGGNLVLPYAPTEDLDLTLAYFQTLDPLSDSNTTNWVLTYHPGAYLWLALSEAALYVGNEAKRLVFESRAQLALETLRQRDVAGSTFAASMPASYVV